MNVHSFCPLCGGNVKVTKRKYPFDMFQCEKCSHVFAANIPSEDELKQYYSKYCYDDYVGVSDITKNRYRDILKRLGRYRNNNKLLEVGCGSGDFLEVARDNNWDVYGSEYSQKAIEILKNKSINCFDDDIHNFQNNIKFDVIVCIEVIEHVDNPLQNVQKYYELLREGGVLYITTPNSKSLTARIVKGSWRIFSYPEHLSYFTPKSLKKLLTRSGFKIVSQKTTGISIALIKNKLFKKKTQIVSPRDSEQHLRVNIEHSGVLSFMKNVVNFVLSVFKIGDTHKVIAVK